MAHAANISQLADDLVRSIVTCDGADFSYDQLRDNASRSLRTSGHSRTNQFEVQSKLSGLVEKFAVLNREDLAEAFRNRLDDLPSDSKWLPEILSLLLMLSDKPLEHTSLEVVEALRADPADEAAKLTWEDITAEDGPDEDGLWDDVERGYHSSGDDGTVDGAGDSDETASTRATSIGENETDALTNLQIVRVKQDVLNDSKHFYNAMNIEVSTGAISELTLIRETLLMLHGLPTSTYESNQVTAQIFPRTGLRLDTASSHILRDVMRQFSDIGSGLKTLRRWVRSQQQTSYLQSCQASLQTLLSQLAIQLAGLDQKYLSVTGNIIVSLIEVKADVERCSRPLLSLSRILTSSSVRAAASTFSLLDALYDQASIAELSGDDEIFQAIVPVLLAGLRTYLRSLSVWISHGICSAEDSTSLVEEANADCARSSFWRDRYTMRSLPDGQPHVPQCIRPFASRAFALGKSRAFLRLLDGRDAEDGDDCSPTLPNFTQIDDGTGFLPFSQKLEEAIESWLLRMVEDGTPTLRKTLLSSHGLQETIGSLNRVFCSEDGIAFQTFADALFRSMKHNPTSWKNGFLLTELAQTTLGGSSTTETSLVVRIDDCTHGQLSLPSVRTLESVCLEMVFSWPVQNITSTSSPTNYSRIFTLLLQIYRAQSLLRQQFYDLRPLAESSIPNGHEIVLRLSALLRAFVDILLAHVTTTALTMKEALLLDIAKADDIDAMAAVWDKHDKQMATSLLLSEKFEPLLRTVVDLLEGCEQCHVLWEELKAAGAAENDDDDKNHEETSSRKEKRASALQNEVDRSLSFLVAGLRGTSRASGNAALETLAERLDWIVH